MAGSPAYAQSQPEVTLQTLLGEMTDLEVLSTPPMPAFTTVQFSSYDRRSTLPNGPGWFDNADGFGREPIPNFMKVLREPGPDGVGEYLMAEVDGPGAIVRTWSAARGMTGTLALHLDEAETPLYEGPSLQFLRCSYGALRGIEETDAEGYTQYDASYLPIPFARHMRMVWTGKVNQIHFYHVNVRRYAAGTRVRTLTRDDLERDRAVLEQTRRILADRTLPAAEGRPVAIDCSVPQGQVAEAFKREEAGTIRELTLRLEAEDPWSSLRQVVLEGAFDGSRRPQIESPLGDFFGSGPGLTAFETLPLQVEADGTMACRFVMPFAKSAVLRVRNLAPRPVRVTGRVIVGAPAADGPLQHFCAKWRVDHGLQCGGGEVYDMPYLCARGRGSFIGAAVMVRNPTRYITLGGGWWGEGDEKIWADDGVSPAFFGTGSEDYFNYSWSTTTRFAHAFCAQPMVTGPGTIGFTSNLRIHMLDRIPFNERFDFFMELFHHTPTTDLSYARIAYFYAAPETMDDAPRIMPHHVRSGLEHVRGYAPLAGGADKNATFVQAESALVPDQPGATLVRTMGAGEGFVRFSPKTDGDALTFRINVEEAGKYQILAVFAETNDSGRVALAVDGVESPKVADLYTPHLDRMDPRSFDVLELATGPHEFKLISRGKSDASRGTAIGVDFFGVSPR